MKKTNKSKQENQEFELSLVHKEQDTHIMFLHLVHPGILHLGSLTDSPGNKVYAMTTSNKDLHCVQEISKTMDREPQSRNVSASTANTTTVVIVENVSLKKLPAQVVWFGSHYIKKQMR